MIPSSNKEQSPAVQKALAVDVDSLLPLIGLTVGHHGEVHNTRTADKDIDRAKLLSGLLHQGLHLGLVRHIRLVDQHFTTVNANLLLDAFQSLGPASRQGHMGTLLGETSCHSGANSRRGTSNDSNLAHQTTLAHLLDTASLLSVVGMVGEGNNSVADKVNRSHLQVPALDVRSATKLKRLYKNSIDQIPSVGRTGDTVAGDGSRTVNPHGDASTARLINKLLGNPLSLTITIQQLGGNIVNIDDSVLTPACVRRWKHTVGRDMVDGGTAAASKSKNLPGSHNVGVSQGSIGVDQVDSGGGVHDNLHTGRELVEDFRGKTKALSCKSTWQNLNTFKLRESHEADDLSVSRINQVLKEESAQVTSDTGKKDRLSVSQSTHGSTVALDVLREYRVCAKDSW
ncbi:hypothetical protein HG530_003846 [Fusarium avenaceum]|nr:hypothetical protein HG530_003846 [Fusarium avenaceum]